ncbi:MAG: hypothetical protein H7Y36_01045 [Armatimonadetes bacterium]|nr:hypothetical protein [Akkermansiaceae bacterium]
MSSSRLIEEFDYHDFHLRGFTVQDYGQSIILDLTSGFEPKRVTILEFSGVVSYRFLHTGGAIITYILEVPFMDAVRETGADFPQEFREHGGLSVDFKSNEEYGTYFENEGFHTWLIHSAIGFIGMVVGRGLGSAQAEQDAAVKVQD